MNENARRLLRACFFLSGCASLILEIAWFKELSYILGNTLLAVSTVVAAFMAGLGVGSAWIARVGERIRRPLRAYGLMELALAVAAVASIPLFRATPPLFETLYRSLEPGNGTFLLLRFLVVFALLFIPVVLMGATLPLIVGAFARSERHDSREAGLLYGVNTLGAVVGTVVASFALLPAVGIWKTCVIAGGIDLVVALTALYASRRAGAIEPPTAPAPRRAGQVVAWSGRQWTVAVLFGFSGAAAIAYQVAWFRVLGLTLGPSVYAFAAMLAVYLLGLGAGSALAARWADRTPLGGVRAMCLLEGALGWIGLAGLLYLNRLPALHVAFFRDLVANFGVAGFPLSHLLLAAVLVLLPCLLMGALFPVVVRAIREAGRDLSPEANVGRVYLGNTIGGIAGSLLAGFVLIPRLGVSSTLLAAGLLSVAIAAVLGVLRSTRHPERPREATGSRFGRSVLLPASIVLGGVVLALVRPELDVSALNQGLYRDLYTGESVARSDPGQLIYHREGRNAPVAVYRTLGSAALHVGGKPDASTNPGDVLTQSLLGHLPVLVAPRAREVAVIGFGSGTTAGALLTHDAVERVDILEIEQAVLDAAPYFAAVNGDPLADPRARLIVEDGRVHLTYAPTMYDVITSEPSNPWMAGVANLFTTEFHATVRARLRPGGVFAQWIQNYDLSAEAFAVILASLAESFPHLIVFQSNPWDFIVLASDQPIEVRWEELQRRMSVPSVQASLAFAGIFDPLHLAYFFVGPENEVRQIAREARARNSDDSAWLEHRAPYEMIRGLTRTAGASPADHRAGSDLQRRSARGRVQGLLALLPGVPVGELVRALVSYPHEWEPGLIDPMVLEDPWGEVRRIAVPGLAAELRHLGEGHVSTVPDALALAEAVPRWDALGDALRAARVRTMRRLQAGAVPTDSLEAIVRADPLLPHAALLLGARRVESGDLSGAEEAFESVLNHPQSRSCYFALLGLAQVAALRGDPATALEWSAAAVQRNPYYSNAYLMRAELFRSVGEESLAQATLRDGLRFNPGHERLEGMRRAAGRRVAILR